MPTTQFIDLSDHDAFVAAVPHEAFAQLRREDPVHSNPEPDGRGFWAVTRYEDIRHVHRKLVGVGAFAVAGADPVLKLFTWLTNLGALGVLCLMTVTSFAVVAFFRSRPDHHAGPWPTCVAPVIAGVLMLVVLVLGVTNFNVLATSSTTAPTDAMSIVLPLILLLAGIAGMVVAAAIRARDPERYARIGERTEVELAERVE